MPRRVHVQHELDEGAMQSRQITGEHGEPRASNAPRCLHIHLPRQLAKINVILWHKIQVTRLAPAKNLLVIVL